MPAAVAAITSTPAAAAEFSVTTVAADIVSPPSGLSFAAAAVPSPALATITQLSQAEFQRRLAGAAATGGTSVDASLESTQSLSIDSGEEIE